MTTLLDPTLRTLNDCGCCSPASSTLQAITNRPGLSAVAYRRGTWHEFRTALIAELAASHHQALEHLATRADDDFTIALLDAVATVCDVLTFYQERIANEAYLRTATERFSILELARLIGYELRPGVAATTLLAFKVEDAPGAPEVATIDVGLKVQSVPGHEEKPQTFETVEKIEARAVWNAMKPKLTAPQVLGMDIGEVWLDGIATDVKPGDWILLVGPEREANVGDEHWDARRVDKVETDFDANRTRLTFGPGLGSKSPYWSAPSAAPRVYALRTQASLFGYNAPDWPTMPTPVKANYLRIAESDVAAISKVTEWTDFHRISVPGVSAASATEMTIDLDAVYPRILPGSWLLLAIPDYAELYRVKQAVPAGRAQFGLAGKVSRITIEGENFEKFDGKVRDATVYAQSVELAPAEAPLVPAVTGLVAMLNLDRDVGDLPDGRVLLLVGREAGSGEERTERVVLDHVERFGSASRLMLTAPIGHSYELASLTIHGNIAQATHGETVAEVLGGGDAGRPYQRFALRQPPLTYVRGLDSPNGANSTLALRVNDLTWQEVPSFYGREPTERAFVTTRDDEGRTLVRFGDGVHGARLPTGQENVRATYRKGIGIGGNVKAGQLTTLLTRPLGVKEATNPQPATGGDDPEPRDAARDNAPLTMLTLDRIVSVRDYEDFARAYAGIAKTLATWSWDGERRGVFITLAGPNGDAIEPDVLELLLAQIRKVGDPYVPVRIGSYRSRTFATTFKVKTDSSFEKAKVHAELIKTLRSAFGFKARTFGQPVSLSEVISTLQGVAGIVAVDVDSLVRTDGVGQSGLLEPLPASLPEAESLGSTLPAELLTLAPDPVVPGEMT